MMKMFSNARKESIVFELTMSILVLILIAPSYALVDENVKWSSDGNTYRLAPTDNVVTEKNYTIKAVEFPFAVRGYKTANGSVYPERPVSPFVKFELYRDIGNNEIPIDTFTISIGDEYVTSDNEMRITIDDIPGSISQDWIYEYYNPWAKIKIQKRALPYLDIYFGLKDTYGNNIDENKIRSGDNIDLEIKIKNTGDDVIDNVDFSIDIGQLLLDNVRTTDKLEDTLYQLKENEEKAIDIPVMIPVSLEEKEYEVQVNITGYDIKDIMYSFNASKIVKTMGDIESIYVEKHISKNTTYLKEYVGVALNIVNTGHMTISNIQIHDAIPDRLIVIKDGAVQNYTEFSLNRSSLGPSESWTVSYSLKPTEPGIYILPKFDTSFSAGGKELSATSSEVGFRVFGPHVILTKSAVDMGQGVANVIVNVKNIGNGPTRVVIEDELPDGTVMMSGDANVTMSLDAGSEKVVNYTIISSDFNISNLIWPPTVATYYLDNWRFTTSSDEKYEEGHMVDNERRLEGGTKVHVNMVISTPAATLPTDDSVYPDVAIPNIEEEQRKVVATISAKTPVQIPEKSTPGFMSYELILLLVVIILSKNVNVRNDDNRKTMK